MINAVAARLGARRKSKRPSLAREEEKWGLIFISPWIIGFLVFTLLPMIASFGFSLLDFNLAVPEEAKFVGLENWNRALFNDPEVLASFAVTFKFAAISLPIGFVFSLFVAVLLNSPNVFGTNIYRTLFYFPTVIPFVAATLIWGGVLNEQTGWINLLLENVLGIKAVGTEGLRWLAEPRLIYFTYTMLGLWGIGNSMMITLAGLRSVPTALYEAAEIDGAGWWRRMRNVTLPMISPVIFYNLVLGVIGLMQYFLPPYVMTGGSGFPEGTTRFIMIYFYKQAFSFFNMGYAAVIAWMIFIVGVVLAGVLFGTTRYWVYYAGEEK
jgi:ABC-type sugar transport system permease subunit